MIAKLHLYLIDFAAALVISFLTGYAMLERQSPPLWLVVPLSLAIGLPVVLRRRWPVLVLAVTSAATAAALVSGTIPVEALGAPLGSLCMAVYTVASLLPRSRSPVLCGLSAVVVVGPSGARWEEFFLFGLVFVASWVIGYTTLLRRSFVERSLEQQASQALTDERLRIARELHDIVAHNLSLITVKAATAAHVRSPEEAYSALEVISSTSRSALAEMRHLLGVLRADASLLPAPSLRELSSLVDRASMAGVSVSLDVRGSLDVPSGVGVSAYRIVQEALTNVVKHAAGASCSVVLEVSPDLVSIEVTDDGPGSLAPFGHGLIGMRERVAVYDGTFSAGPLAAGGFRVRAELPHR